MHEGRTQEQKHIFQAKRIFRGRGREGDMGHDMGNGNGNGRGVGMGVGLLANAPPLFPHAEKKESNNTTNQGGDSRGRSERERERERGGGT